MSIIIGAIVSLLIFFFEQWWKSKHPQETNWPIAKTAFLEQVNSKWRFKLIPRKKREQWAGKLFDKFQTKYQETPQQVSDMVLTSLGARALAEHTAANLTLNEDER